MDKKEKVGEERTLYQNLTGSSKTFGHVAQAGLVVAVLGLFVKYFFYTVKAQGIKGDAGNVFAGIGDFFGLFEYLGFGVLIIGLLSIALVGKEVHLYLRIGLLLSIALILGRFVTFGIFF
ncbi:MAG: hypothetical protein ACMUHY_06520 [Thermoplasmatota archaeon]